MLQELFKAVQVAAVEGAKPQPVKVELVNGIIRVYDQDGTHEDVIAIPDRRHVLGSVDQIGPFVEYHTGNREADPVVWFDDVGVTVVLNDCVGSRRNDLTCLTFSPTEEFAFVSKMAEEDPEFVPAKTMIKTLRRQLWDAFESESKRDSLIKLLRTVRFEDDEQGKLGTVKRSISSIADGEGDFPSQVTLSLRPFDDPALKASHSVKCHFEVDPDSKSFALIPLKSELKRAADDALQSLQALLVASVKCPCFRGSPAQRTH